MSLQNLEQATIAVAQVECKQNKNGCGGQWCTAQNLVRASLDELGIKWRPDPAPVGVENEQRSVDSES